MIPKMLTLLDFHLQSFFLVPQHECLKGQIRLQSHTSTDDRPKLDNK